MLSSVLLASLAFAQAVPTPPVAGQVAPPADTTPALREPAYAKDGRLAVSAEGNLWMLTPGGQWTRITAGGASDREPAWATDGRTLVFSSDRSGHFALWQVGVGPTGATNAPSQLTRTAQPDGEPVVTPDGRVIFVRGRGAGAQLWVRSATGTESRLTQSRATEQWPALSPDGSRLAYVSLSDSGRKIRVRDLATGHDTVLVSNQPAEHLAWSADGATLAFISTAAAGRGGRGGAAESAPNTGLLAANVERGTVTRLVGRRAETAWSPDGKHLVLADEVPDDAVGYNGDPDRLGSRNEMSMFSPTGQCVIVDASAPSDSAGAERLAVPESRADRNAHVFDQAWTRTANLYYADSAAADRRARWVAVGKRFRPKALRAKNDDELRSVIHDMLLEHPPYRASATGRAAVASANPTSTAAGVEILREGGNVVDAAVAVSFALGVVEPDASGPGGYGQMLIYRPGMDHPNLIEFMTRVPEDAGLDRGAPAQVSRDGPAEANVPGTVAAMYLAWQRYGSKKVPWADLLAPAIRAARDGYVVSEGLATTLTVERDNFMRWPASRALFYKDGRAPRAGDTLRNPDLAWTLEQIANGGADGFYKGEVAERLVTDLRSHGNAMKASDLAKYFAADREPVRTTYRGYTIYSSAPPVSGGAELAAQLNLLELFPKPKPYTEDAPTLNAMIAAWQLVPPSRGKLNDPSFWPVETMPFTSKDTAKLRWRCFDPAHALSAAAIRGDSIACGQPEGGAPGQASQIELATPPACEAHGYDAPDLGVCRAAGTTAFVVGDGNGNVVAATQTLGTWGGGFYVSPGLGFLYNDKLGSYGSDPNASGGRIAYARHGSTLAPTIVLQGTGDKRRAVMAVGAAGNSWITSAVYQTLVGMIDDHLDPQAALELPRFLLGGGRGGGAGGGTSVQMEDGFSPTVMNALERMGYRPQLISLPGEVRMGYGSALEIEKGKVTAGADPRRAGAAGAIGP